MDRAALTMLLLALTVLPPRAAPPAVAPISASSAGTLTTRSLPPLLARPVDATPGPRSNLSPAEATPAVSRLADDVLATHDNASRPFVIIDKRNAHLYVIDADGRLLGHAPVLLGAARGDDSVPGIGERPMAEIRSFERTTPAGRFIAALGQNAQGEEIVWVDYGAAISMHRVRPVNPRERRLQRLASPTPADNRISYGCINMPVVFFDEIVGPLFRRGPHAVYILPEVRPVQEVFAWRGARHHG